MNRESFFFEMLKLRWREHNTLVCVGLDSEHDKLPDLFSERFSSNLYTPYLKRRMVEFNKKIIDATQDLVCAYKPNIAFYGAQGTQGMEALAETIAYIREVDSDIPVILDAKMADIGNTSRQLAEQAFDDLQVDAVTVNPYLGAGAIEPFLNKKDNGILVLCRTSNPGAGEFQDLEVDGTPVYQIVANQVAEQWNSNNNCGLVVGATYPRELQEVRSLVGDMPLLIPGVGKQEGELERTVKAGLNQNKEGIIINSSRSIIFASDGEDFAEAAREVTIDLKSSINQIMEQQEKEQ